MKRKLTVIMAADVAGYTRLMAADEGDTVRRLNASIAIFADAISAAGGRIFNTAGDAILAEFPSVVDGVRAVIDIQESIRRRNGAYPAPRHMLFRIGMTIGDVTEQDGDLLGDAVNIAARLQALAEPGGICLSRAVHEQTIGKLSLGFTDLGPQRLKNVPHPVQVFAFRPEPLVAPKPRRIPAAWVVLASLVALIGGAFAFMPQLIGLREAIFGGSVLKDLKVPVEYTVVAELRPPSPNAPMAAAPRPVEPAPPQVLPPLATPAPMPSRPVPPPLEPSQSREVASATPSAKTTAVPAPNPPAPAPPPATAAPRIHPPRLAPAERASLAVGGPFDPAQIPFICDACRARIASQYGAGTQHRALAISRTTPSGYGLAVARATEDEARQAAIDICEAPRPRNDCQIFSINGRVVYDPARMPYMPAKPWYRLPNESDARVDISRLAVSGPAQEEIVKRYLAAGHLKAMALNHTGTVFYWSETSNLDEAARRALESCGAVSRGACRIVAIGDFFVVPATTAPE